MGKGDREKFKKLAERRVNRLIKTARLIGNLSNRSNYSYSTADVDKIFAAVNEEIKAARARFAKPSKSDDSQFKLE